MALFCNCGAELPDQARFCHNCGKPQREQDLPVAEAQAFAPYASAAAPPAINFGNPIAVRVAVLCAGLSILLNLVLAAINPLLRVGCCAWLLGAGFLSVFLYARRTGVMLSVADGARLGWITGLFSFVMEFAFTAIGVFLTRSSGAFRESLRQAIEKMPVQGEAAREAMEALTRPAALAVFLIAALFVEFLVTASLAIAGGALGAKVLEKE